MIMTWRYLNKIENNYEPLGFLHKIVTIAAIDTIP